LLAASNSHIFNKTNLVLPFLMTWETHDIHYCVHAHICDISIDMFVRVCCSII